MFKGGSEWPVMWVISYSNPGCFNSLGGVLSITAVGGESLHAFIGFQLSALACFPLVHGAIPFCALICASE